MSFDVNKLLQKMQDQAPKAKSGKGPPAGAQPKQKQQPQDGPSKKRQREDSSTKPAPTSEQKPQAVTSPATPAGEGKRAKKSKKKAATAAAMADSPAPRPSEHPTPVASTSRSTTTTHEAREVVRHSAPSLTVVGSTLTGSTKKGSVQDKLRAQLAGGKFRMLNEQLYTTSGDDAHRLMKEDGAFDDVSFFSLVPSKQFLPAVLSADRPHTTRAVSHWLPLTSCYVAGPPARLDRAIPVDRPAAQFPHCRLWLRRRRARSHSLPALVVVDVAEYDLATAADPVAQGARESRQDEAAQSRFVRPREPVELRRRGRVLVGPAAGRSRRRRGCRRGGVLSELDGDGLDPYAPRSAPGAQGRVSRIQGRSQGSTLCMLTPFAA